jgi:hypothetical protein
VNVLGCRWQHRQGQDPQGIRRRGQYDRAELRDWLSTAESQKVGWKGKDGDAPKASVTPAAGGSSPYG